MLKCKGGSKVLSKKKCLFLWVLFVAKVAFLNRLIIADIEERITRISCLKGLQMLPKHIIKCCGSKICNILAYKCCQSVSLSIVEVMFVLCISMYFCPWMEPWNMLHIWKESKAGNFPQIYLGHSYMKHFWKNSNFANHLWFSCCALLAPRFWKKQNEKNAEATGFCLKYWSV